ncbi:MAG: glutamine-hydrolyzing GMP synthase [Spirochaetota bacterium]
MGKKVDTVLVLDFGSQYTQLIARKVRELGVYSEIVPYTRTPQQIMQYQPGGIILSGGPQSVYRQGAPSVDRKVFSLGVPVLGICYGYQLIATAFGGKVLAARHREYGKAHLNIEQPGGLFKGFDPSKEIVVWMSHGDRIEQLPPGFKAIAHTPSSPFAAVSDQSNRIFGVQFHPEVSHTPRGSEILKNFLEEICGLERNWSIGSFVEKQIERIRQKVNNNKVICALSGGVDSSVVATLLGKAVGKNTKAVFINNGLLRKDEHNQVIQTFSNGFDFDFIYVDASKEFLSKLRKVTDPEKKRKIIGMCFIKTFEQKAKQIGNIEYLAQGTLYPDVIESVSSGGPSATIKSHHNVGGLPSRMKLGLIEPLRELFKDEVRKLGKLLGLPDEIVERHPFPGPGLAVRIIGEITRQRVDILGEADSIIREEIKNAGLYNQIWQAFGVLLPIKSVGVMGDERTYENVCVVRAVHSVDGMTADWSKIPYHVLEKISSRIINEVKGINRVVYDISSKPPSTIEWE